MTDVSAHTDIEMGSERSFGLVFAVVFVVVGLWPLIWHGGEIRLWSFAIAAVFAALALLRPTLLRPLNKIWYLFGLLLGRIVAPIVMGIIFFVTVTPIGLLRRLRNPDPLNQKIDPDAKTYWVVRDTEELKSQSMRKQF